MTRKQIYMALRHRRFDELVLFYVSVTNKAPNWNEFRIMFKCAGEGAMEEIEETEFRWAMQLFHPVDPKSPDAIYLRASQ